MAAAYLADGGYAGEKLRTVLAGLGRWTIEIIKRSDTAKGFEVLPRRWVVDRTFTWLGRCRRLAKDFEQTIASASAWVLISHIRILTRRLARVDNCERLMRTPACASNSARWRGMVQLGRSATGASSNGITTRRVASLFTGAGPGATVAFSAATPSRMKSQRHSRTVSSRTPNALAMRG